MGTNARTSKSIKVVTRGDVGASQTATPISDTFAITEDGSKNFIVDVDVSSVTVGGGISIALEDTSNGFTSSEVKSKTTAITADGTVSLSFLAELAGDQTNLPLRSDARIVITTGAGSAVTIDEIRVVQGQ